VCDAPGAPLPSRSPPLPGEAATGQEMAPKPRQNSKQAYFVGCYAWLLGCYAWLLKIMVTQDYIHLEEVYSSATYQSGRWHSPFRCRRWSGRRASASVARLTNTRPGAPPTTKADVGRWDVGIVQRAEEILASPAQWNRADTGKCPADAKTFSISCALQKAVEEAETSIHDRQKMVYSTPPLATIDTIGNCLGKTR
jgi:hypothetical protein